MLHRHRPGWFQGLCPWRVQGGALVLLPFPRFLGAGNGHEVLAERPFGACMAPPPDLDGGDNSALCLVADLKI